MSKEVRCPECGKVFEKREKRQTYCCVECRIKHYQKNKPKKLYYHCEYCGKVYEQGSENKYCSDECKSKYASGRNKKSGRKKKPLSIVEVETLARAEGLSFGQYVKKYKL